MALSQTGNLMRWMGQALAGIGLLLMLTSVRAEVNLQDPTRPPWQVPASAGGFKAEVRYRLDSILYSPERRVAIINGRSLSEGERLDALTLLKIEERRVLVRLGGQVKELLLKPVSSVRR